MMLPCQLGLGALSVSPTGTDGAHFRIGKLMIWMKLTMWASPFLGLVPMVFQRGAIAKMIWSNAKSIVAAVQDRKTGRDWSIMQNHAKAVCFDWSVSNAVNKTVSVTIGSARPNPASPVVRKDENLGPKPFNNGGSQSLTGEVIRSYRDHAISGFARYALQGLASIFFVATRNANLNVFPSSRSLAFGGTGRVGGCW